VRWGGERDLSALYPKFQFLLQNYEKMFLKEILFRGYRGNGRRYRGIKYLSDKKFVKIT